MRLSVEVYTGAQALRRSIGLTMGPLDSVRFAPISVVQLTRLASLKRICE